MEELNKKVTGIRKMMEEMKTELYAIVNPALESLDEYRKTLYLKVLCTIIQYENNPTDMQVLYLKRIVKGMKADEPLEEYMRKALEISNVDVQEFLSFMKENSVRYFFALESILLAAMGNGTQSNYEYLAELIELCEITKKDLEYLLLVAKSVLQQESSYYEEAKEVMTDNMAALCFAPYIENYYAGAIMETLDEVYYSAPDKEMGEHIEYPDVFVSRNITFTNLNLTIDDQWRFEGCETVKFVNCTLYNSNAEALYFQSIGCIQFEGCDFYNFGRYVAVINAVNEINITNCKFNNCGRTCYSDDKQHSGGMFHFVNAKNIKSFIFTDNSVLICYIKAGKSVYGVTGILFDVDFDTYNTHFIIKNNEFIGCQCINNENYTAAIISGTDGETDNIECSDNRCTGEVTRLFEY